MLQLQVDARSARAGPAGSGATGWYGSAYVKVSVVPGLTPAFCSSALALAGRSGSGTCAGRSPAACWAAAVGAPRVALVEPVDEGVVVEGVGERLPRVGAGQRPGSVMVT